MPKAIQESGAFNSTGGLYRPPDYFDTGAYRKMSIHAYHTGGQHPLAERARKLKTEGILIIRFEMPFNIWCDHCGDLITMGIRFNAEKKKIGAFHTTDIYSFAMKCCFCGGQIVIETDPEHRTYAVRRGGRMQTKAYDASDDPNATPLETPEAVNLRRADPMTRTEQQEADHATKATSVPQLQALLTLKDKTAKSDYDMHRRLKKRFRSQHGLFSDRQKIEAAAARGRILPPETAADRSQAGQIAFRSLPVAIPARLATAQRAAQWDRLLT